MDTDNEFISSFPSLESEIYQKGPETNPVCPNGEFIRTDINQNSPNEVLIGSGSVIGPQKILILIEMMLLTLKEVVVLLLQKKNVQSLIKNHDLSFCNDNSNDKKKKILVKSYLKIWKIMYIIIWI